MIERISQEQYEGWLKGMKEGKNKTFAKGAMNLWIRFKNFEKNAPIVLRVDGEIKCAIMITKLSRASYVNLYEIVTATGEEGNGYARELYWTVMSHFHSIGVERLKMSCTPSSIGWHMSNGVIGWGVDATGSIRVDIPLKATREEQLAFRETCTSDDNIVELYPPGKVRATLLKEDFTFGKRKTEKVDASKAILGDFYLRDLLWYCDG